MAAFSANFAKPLPSVAAGKKKVLLIISHPNVGKSFNHKLVETAKETLEKEGHAVIVDDLCAISFNPAVGWHDFTDPENPDTFDGLDMQGEQKHAALKEGGGGLAPDIQEQLDLVDWCDVVIHQFPLYWWSLPAVHKGWMDRVLVYYYCYGGDSSKRFNGKKWMLSLTAGGPTQFYAGNSPFMGDPLPDLLRMFSKGTPELVGMSTLPTFLCGGPGKASPEDRNQMRSEYASHIQKYVCESLGEMPKQVHTATLPIGPQKGKM